MISWFFFLGGIFLLLDAALADWGSKHLPRHPWHQVPGSGFYAAWLRMNAPMKSLWADILDIEPGHITVLSDKRNGNQYALMNLDDFEHLIGTGNRFVMKRLSDSAKPEPNRE